MMGVTKSKLKLAPVLQPVNVPAFDYGGATDVHEIEATADAFTAREADYQQTSIEHAIRQGKLLAVAKERLGHGLFTRWVENRLGVSDQTGRNYMYAAATYGDKSQIVLDLPLAVAYKLAAPSTPQTVKDKVLSALENGEKPTPQDIVSQINTAKIIASVEKEKVQKLAAKMAGKSVAEAEKIKKQQAAYAKKKAAKEAADEAAREAEQVARKQAAQDAVFMLKDRLGDDFTAFVGLYQRSRWDFDRSIQEAV